MSGYKTCVGAVAGVLFASTAFAADIPTYEKAPVVAPPPVTFYNWTGIYAGINAGYAWGDYDLDLVPPLDFSGDGFVLGGTLGYNWQIDQFVIGVEGDLAWTDIDGSGVHPILSPPALTAESDWFGTVRARAGIAIDNVLVYGTGGLAFVRNEVAIGNFSDSTTSTGWTVGAGVEVGITENLSVKGEYLYVDAGEESYDIGSVVTITTGDWVDYNSHVVRAGLNYRFNLF